MTPSAKKTTTHKPVITNKKMITITLPASDIQENFPIYENCTNFRGVKFPRKWGWNDLQARTFVRGESDMRGCGRFRSRICVVLDQIESVHSGRSYAA